jgi:hypothetical protein
VTLTSHVRTHGGAPVAVTASAKKKPKPKPKGTIKVVTVGSATYSVASGMSSVVKVMLNATGKKLLGQFYTLPATLAVSGTTSLTKTVTLAYAVVRSPISFTWTFGPSSTVAQELTVSKIPRKGTVEVICHGGGCPFAKRSFSPKAGKVSLASLFKGGLKPHATLELEVTAPNEVAKVATFTILAGAQPSAVASCLPPGAKSPTRCAKAS